jgi:hypothetical protein
VSILGLGLALHWEKRDVDLSVPGLLAGLFGTKAYMDRERAARAGSATSPAKAAAARRNGTKGGRPRKSGGSELIGKKTRPATSNTYRIYLPFDLAEGKAIGEPIPFKGRLGGYVAEMKRNQPHYGLHILEVPDETVELEFKKLLVGLYWLALELRSGVMFDPNPQKEYYPKDPIQSAKSFFGDSTKRIADVVIDGGQPAIWPNEKHHVTVTAQSVRAILSYNPARIFQILDEGMRLPDPSALLASSKLKLAIELYCLAHFRSSDFARFLVLCTVLETAAPQPSLSQPCVKFIDSLIEQARGASKSRDTRPEQEEQFTQLAQRLGTLKRQSHRSRIYQFVERMLKLDGHPDATEQALQARDCYDKRGELVHGGKHEVGDALPRLDDVVCKTLKAAMRHSFGQRRP